MDWENLRLANWLGLELYLNGGYRQRRPRNLQFPSLPSECSRGCGHGGPRKGQKLCYHRITTLPHFTFILSTPSSFILVEHTNTHVSLCYNPDIRTVFPFTVHMHPLSSLVTQNLHEISRSSSFYQLRLRSILIESHFLYRCDIQDALPLFVQPAHH